jgi:23S rRNA (guanosine2251-2'-O)-methyltransferase
MSATRLVGGIHAVRSALSHGSKHIRVVWIDRDRRDKRVRELEQKAIDAGVTVRKTDRQQIEQLLGEQINHQGVAAEVDVVTAKTEQDLYRLLESIDHVPLLLVLDGITDPHNLGACLRSADATGVDAVIAPRDNAVGLTPVAVKVASGAAESVPYIQVTNLARCLQKLQKDHQLWIYGAAGETDQQLFDTDLTMPVALVMGAEGSGLRRLTKEHCDGLFALPMLGQVESLNVSVAAGVCLYEALRQRRGRQ